MVDKSSFFIELESTGESEVRIKLAKQVYSSSKVPLVQEWLRQREDERSSAAALRTEAREEESLSISRNALKISSRANTIAIIAMILSVTTAIIVTIIEVLSK